MFSAEMCCTAVHYNTLHWATLAAPHYDAPVTLNEATLNAATIFADTLFRAYVCSKFFLSLNTEIVALFFSPTILDQLLNSSQPQYYQQNSHPAATISPPHF
jgi:hypothetical protein